MHRAAVFLVLGIALAFAALPGVIALSFTGGSPLEGQVATRLDVAGGTITVSDVPQSLAKGVTDSTGCTRTGGPDSSQF